MTVIESLASAMSDPTWRYVLLQQGALDALAAEFGDAEQVGPALGHLVELAGKPLLVDQARDAPELWHLIIPPAWLPSQIERYIGGMDAGLRVRTGMEPVAFMMAYLPAGELWDVGVLVAPQKEETCR